MSEQNRLETSKTVRGENEVTPDGEPGQVAHQFGALVQRENKEERKGMLQRLFGRFGETSAQAKDLVGKHVSEAWTPYESRSALLQKNAEHAPRATSLTDNVRRLLGRS